MKDVFKGFYSIDSAVLEELWEDEKTLWQAPSLLDILGGFD
jgi:hypothetical protein